MRVLALQSGTSIDAIDVAIIDFTVGLGDTPEVVARVVATTEAAWPDDLRRELLDASAGAALDAGSLLDLDVRAGHAFAEAASGLAAQHPGTIDLVVSHGQTIHHEVREGRAVGTLQLGSAAPIAERLETAVLSDLRSADIAAGGEGAPLMAFFDRAWLGAEALARDGVIATVNLGGIANVQLVSGSGVVAFDTGPAGALSDAIVQRASAGERRFDPDGTIAASGEVDGALLAELLSHPYFALQPPKSTGRETFTTQYVDRAIERVGAASIREADLLATLAELTARTVADAVRAAHPFEVIVSGGGVRNNAVMTALRAHLPGSTVLTSDERGVPAVDKEIIMFATLGMLTAYRVPVALTGSRAPRLAGRLSLHSADAFARFAAFRSIRGIGSLRVVSVGSEAVA